MALHSIDNPLSDDGRNKLNTMFQELYEEYYASGKNATEAKEKALAAVADSVLAKGMAEETRQEMINIIREQTSGGDIIPEVVQARGQFQTVGERFNTVTTQLADTATNIGSIEMFGGKGDWNGVSGTENSTAFSNAFNVANTIYLFLPKGKFKTAQLQIPTDKDVVIQGMGKDLTEVYCTGRFFTCINPSLFTTTLTTALTEGGRVINVANGSGAKVGQLITLSSTQNMEETTRTVIKSHSAIITAITGNSITLDRPVPCDFSITGYTVTVKGFKVGKVKIANLTVSGEYDGYFGDIQYAAGFEVENVKEINRNKKYQGETSTGGFDPLQTGGTMHGFRVMYSVDTKFTAPEFEYLSYGVMPSTGSVGTTIERPVTRRGRHTAAPTGGSQGYTCRDGLAYECYAGFDSHEGAYDSRHYNCHSYGDEIEVKLRGRYDIFHDCHFSGGLLTTHDPGIRALENRSKFKKSGQNITSDKHAIFDDSISISIKGASFKGYISHYRVLDLFSVEDIDLYMPDGTIINNFAFWLSSARLNSFNNIRLFGPNRGIDQTGKVVSANTHKAFRIDRNDLSGITSLKNIEIDGFDHGLSFTSAMELSNFTFENIRIKNCVYGIWNATNYKDNPTFRGLSYVGCATNVHEPWRFRSNTRPTNPIHGQQYYDQTLAKPIWYDALAAVWKDATGIAV